VQHWRHNLPGFLSVSTVPMLWLCAFFLAPLAIVWTYSFGTSDGLTHISAPHTFANYSRAIEPIYLHIIAKSVRSAALTSFLCVLIGFPVALAIVFASERWRPWLLLLVILPFWTNLLIRTYALIAVLRQEGYVNFGLAWIWSHFGQLLAGSGIASLPAFVPYPLLYNNFAVVFGLLYVQLPFAVLPLYAALSRLDRSLIEASLDLGAGHLQTMLRIVLPLAVPGVLSSVLLTFIPSLGAFLVPDLLGGPDSQMIANVIARQFKQANDWPFGAALSFLLIYATLVLIMLRAWLSEPRASKAAIL
jgi:spermidine/putrescine transport system permease protein